MAKGLKSGDVVTVHKELRLPRKSEPYQQGLKRIKPGDMGKVVGEADGRSVLVEFNGVKLPLASQRLDKAPQPTNGDAPRRGRRSKAESGDAGSSAPAATADRTGLIDFSNPKFLSV